MTRTDTTTPSRPLTDDARPRWRAVLAIAIAVAVAAVPAALGDTIVSLIARQIGGVSGKFTPMQPAAYIPLTIIGLIAGALGWYTITRVSARPGRILRWLVPAAIVLSFIPDIAVGISKTLPYTTWAGVAALMVMHVVVAGAGVASYHSFLPSRDDRRRERPGQDRGARRGDAGRDSGAAAQPGAPSCPGRSGRKPRAAAAPGLVPGLTVASAAARPGWVAYPGGTQPPPRTAAISPRRPLRVESDVAEVTALARPGLAGLGGAAAARPVARRTATAVAGHQLMPHTAWQGPGVASRRHRR